MNSEVHIKAALRGNITFLEKGYCTPPLKIANITEDKKGPTLQLMLMSSSPGILDHDEYKINIEVNKSCSLDVKTQSYQRLFNMKTGASQTMEVQLQTGSSFCFLPQPCVPHEGAIFVSRNKILLSDNCRLTWGEVLTCGRKLNGEMFVFSRYHSVTEIYLNHKLTIRENLLMQPSIVNVHAIGQMEGYTHQATLIYLCEKASIQNLVKEITAFLSIHHEIAFGITKAQVNGLIVRILGFKAEQLFTILNSISAEHLQKNTLQYSAW